MYIYIYIYVYLNPSVNASTPYLETLYAEAMGRDMRPLELEALTIRPRSNFTSGKKVMVTSISP